MEDFESIYRTYFRDVFLYIKSLSHNEAIAEEITAETFFRALKSIDRFKGACDIRVWLCQIAKNCYFSYLRRQKRVVDFDSVKEQADPFDIQQFICNADRSTKIHTLVHQLDEPYKEVFLLRVFGELSFRQIADLFGKTANWACVTFHRARMKIKNEMEDNS